MTPFDFASTDGMFVAIPDPPSDFGGPPVVFYTVIRGPPFRTDKDTGRNEILDAR